MKKVVLFVVFLLCLALVAVILFNLDDMIHSDAEDEVPGQNPGVGAETVEIDGIKYLPRRNVKNYLIIGVDEFGNADSAGVAQADFLLVMSFDGDSDTYTFLSINRDTMTEIEINDYFGGESKKSIAQIALSHNDGTYEGVTNHSKCLNTASAVSNLLYGVKFDGYISMTMDAVEKIVDYIGGVTMTMDHDATEIDPSLAEGETVTLNGALALKYIRSRGGLEDSSNVSRMERQRRFLSAFINTLGGISFTEDELVECYEQVSSFTVAKDGIDTFDALFGKISSYECGEMLSLPGESLVGDKYMEFHVDQEGTKEIVKNVFYKKAE